MARQNRPHLKLDSQGRAISESANWTTFRGEYYAGTSNLKYIGFARPGADTGDTVWQLSLCAYDASNNLISVKYPENDDGVSSADYIFEYDERATYTYS